jgi:hypothetical protein
MLKSASNGLPKNEAADRTEAASLRTSASIPFRPLHTPFPSGGTSKFQAAIVEFEWPQCSVPSTTIKKDGRGPVAAN